MPRLRFPVPSTRTLVAGAWVLALACGALIIYLLATVIDLSMADERSLDDRRALQEAVKEDRERIAILAEQVEQLGGDPIVEPDEPLPREVRYVPVPGPRGPEGPEGPAAEDGTDGRDGAPGPGPSQAQINAAVAAYCAARNDCRGPAGANGSDGSDGSDGQDGRDGRGIADVVCTGGLTPVTFTFAYTDGTTQTVTCGALAPVE